MAVKVGAGIGLVALGAGASGAIAGFALGAGVVAGVGLAAMAPDLEWSWSALAGRHLWASTQGLMAIQAGVAVLASMDVVIGSLIIGTQPAMATYLAANILGRVPVFIGTALSIVVFPRMIARRTHPSAVIRESMGLYLKLCLPLTLCTITLPGPITGAIFPARYGDVAAILPWSALAGFLMGVGQSHHHLLPGRRHLPTSDLPAGRRGRRVWRARHRRTGGRTASSVSPSEWASERQSSPQH